MNIGRKTRNVVLSAARRTVKSHPLLHSMARDWSRYERFSVSLSRKRSNVTFVPILGMHRSGTSCITNLLAANGLYLGSDLIDPNSDNPRGFWESSEAIAINSALLRRYGSHYLDPPPYLARFTSGLFRRAKRYLFRLGRQPVVAWKDPRTTLTWPAWHELLYKNRYHVIACFRNPQSVSASLQAIYDDMTDEKAVEVWLRYNRRLVAIDEAVEWVNFDAPLAPQIQRVCGRVGLPFNQECLDRYDEGLVHNEYRAGATGNVEVDCVYNWMLACWQRQEQEQEQEAS